MKDLETRGPSFWSLVLGMVIIVALALAGLLLAVGVSGLAGDTRAFWYLSRSAGFVAYLLLWGSVVWGLLLSAKIGKGRLKPPALLDAHQFLSNVALGFALFHGLVLVGDQYIGYTLGQILTPFASGYKTVLTAAGQIGLWLSVLITLSFYLRKRIGYRRWRSFHYASFVAYVLALAHSALMGTDTHLLLVKTMYLATAGVVIFLTAYRVFDARDQRQTVTA